MYHLLIILILLCIVNDNDLIQYINEIRYVSQSIKTWLALDKTWLIGRYFIWISLKVFLHYDSSCTEVEMGYITYTTITVFSFVWNVYIEKGIFFISFLLFQDAYAICWKLLLYPCMHIVSFIQPAHSYVAFVLLWSQFSTRTFQSSHVFYLNFHSSHANGYFEKFWTNESHNSYMIPISFYLSRALFYLSGMDGWGGGSDWTCWVILFSWIHVMCVYLCTSVLFCGTRAIIGWPPPFIHARGKYP